MDLHALRRTDYLALPDDERPHIYPGREPSNSTYTGTKNQPGCRCPLCRSEHASYVRKSRQVIQLEPEFVTDRPIPARVPEGEAQPAPQARADVPEASPDPPPAQPVYDDPGPLTAEQVADRVLKLAASVAESNGGLPLWMISAPEIARRYGVPEKVAQMATRINGASIKVDAYLKRPRLTDQKVEA